MEAIAQCTSHVKLLNHPLISSPKSINPATQSSHFPSSTCSFRGHTKQSLCVKFGAQKKGRAMVVFASSTESDTLVEDADQRWILEPVGDGDWRHIGYQVQMPGSYEIVSNEATVGRVPEKADIVIPVATVSGLHAQLRRKEGSLYVKDLGSTNGTFINEKRMKPGLLANVQPGSLIAFGDVHLAIFRVSKLVRTSAAVQEHEEAKQIPEPEGTTEAVATTS